MAHLSRLAIVYGQNCDAAIIVFCGVRFMAETAKILSPDKTVLIPSRAGCSLASSITARDVRELKRRFPGGPVVTYVNTYADVKAECSRVIIARRCLLYFDSPRAVQSYSR
jgi:quinolinate synthase